MGIIHSIISRPEYKPIPVPIEELPKPKTPEQLENERIENETRKKFENLTNWVVEKIKVAICKRPDEFIVELPISSIRPIDYHSNSPYHISIPVYTYLHFKKVDSNHNLYYEQTFHIDTDNTPSSKPLFSMIYSSRGSYSYLKSLIDMNYINMKYSNSDINICIFLKMIYSKINNLYIDTYEERFIDDISQLYDERMKLFEDMSNVTFKKVNSCKKCDGKTKNLELCYFCGGTIGSPNPPP